MEKKERVVNSVVFGEEGGGPKLGCRNGGLRAAGLGIRSRTLRWSSSDVFRALSSIRSWGQTRKPEESAECRELLQGQHYLLALGVC